MVGGGSPPEYAGGRSGDVEAERLVGRGPHRLVGLDGSAESLAEEPELRYVFVTQVGVAFREVLHRVVEPVLLVLWGCLEHAASEDVGEELVAGLFKGGWCVFSQFTFLFPHALIPFGTGGT